MEKFFAKFRFIKEIIFCLKIIFKTSKLYTILRFALQVISGLLPLMSIYLSKLILDLFTERPTTMILNSFVSLIIVFFTVRIMNVSVEKLETYFQQMQAEMVENTVSKRIIAKSSCVDLSFFDSPQYYDKLQWVKTNASAVNQVIWNLVTFTSSVVAFVVSFVVMWKYSRPLSLLMAIAYIPIVICDQLYIKKMYNWQINNIGEQRKMGYITSIVTQKAHSKAVRIFGISTYLLDIFTGVWQGWFKKRKIITKKWSVITLILSIIPQMLTVIVLYEVGINIFDGMSSIGDFSYYSGIIGQIVSSLFVLTNCIVQISENQIRIKDFREFLDWENLVEGTGTKELKCINTIEFVNMSFTYPGNKQATLEKINLKIQAKDKIALVGVNGAGKTTLIKLLLRFYDPTEGDIMINGISITQYTPESIRKQYSTMFQDYTNYAFSLRENLKIANLEKDFSEAELMEACQKGGIDDLVEKWEMGLDTFLYREFDADGEELSGGENQKISLARMFARESCIIVLDEPSASLDLESEFMLFSKMIELCENKGLVLITHRLSNITLVDRIVVIEDGTVVEEGTHSDLIKKNGRYATLFKYQTQKTAVKN